MNAILNDALKLNLPERMQLVQDIWDSFASFPEALELTETQQLELNKRLQAFHSNREIEALLRVGLYKSHAELISEAIRNLLINNESLRLELAVDLFKSDEISLGRAAEIAGIDRWEFQDILHERQIPIIIEAESAEAIDKNIARFFGREQ